ncbi:MAG: ParB/RepB/Spo0J family partition protein [Chloroflexota bacterium]
MTRKGKLADIDPFGGSESDDKSTQAAPRLSMSDADAALFGELTRRESGRQTVRPLSIFAVYPDVKQPRRAVPSQVRAHWSGEPNDIADLFNEWLKYIDLERKQVGRPPFNLDDFLWAEAVEARRRTEDEAAELRAAAAGPVEFTFVKVVELAISIRRDGLANPVTVHRTGDNAYTLETGERRWLAYHVLYGYFNGEDGKPQERDKWQNIPAIVVDRFSVWRQASENAARADLNAIGRARQFSILLMDLLERQGVEFTAFDDMVKVGESDRPYYAQAASHRVPSGKGEMLSNGLGVSHRAAFSRCRTLLNLPDEVWTIGDNLDLSEDELLRLAKMEPDAAIAEARRIARNVASRNNSMAPGDAARSKPKSPAPLADAALKRGKRLFPKQKAIIARNIFEIRDGVGQANAATKRVLRQQINDLRRCLNELEEVMDQTE